MSSYLLCTRIKMSEKKRSAVVYCHWKPKNIAHTLKPPVTKVNQVYVSIWK